MSFDLNTIKDLAAEGYGLNAQASAFLLSQLEKVTAELDAAVKNHRKHAARLITEKVVVMEERDMLLDALKDCHDRLKLLRESGRGKMLDSRAEGKAANALTKAGARP